MNCQEFDVMVSGLVNHHLLDTSARETGLAHAATCRRCALRLADERVLNTGLVALAESTQAHLPTPQLRANLRAAFAAQRRSNALAADIVPAATVLPFRPRTAQKWSRWPLAAAAAALLLLAISGLLLMRPHSPINQTAGNNTGNNSGNTSATVTPSPKVTIVPEPDPALTPAPVAERTKQEVAVSKVPATIRRRKVQRNFATAVARQETTTDFIPLTYTSDASSMSNGMIVRVEVERATLIAMGLPLNTERSASRVTADLMLGDDGVARAIRLVN
jgi:hypothetical protein